MMAEVTPMQIPAHIAAFLPDSLTVVQTAAFYLEVIPKSINKGQGIRDICRVLGISPAEVIAFGDAANDIPMLEFAHMGFCPQNAIDSVKAIPGIRVLSNCWDDATAEMITIIDKLY